MAQIREFESTTESYFILDGVSYPKVYEAMLDSSYSNTKIKLVGTNRDNAPLVFSTEYTNIRVDGDSFGSASEAISRLNQVVFSKGGGSGDGGTVLAGYLGEAKNDTIPPTEGVWWFRAYTAGTKVNFKDSANASIVVSAADLDIVNGVANNEVIIEVNNGVASKKVRRVKGDAGAEAVIDVVRNISQLNISRTASKRLNAATGMPESSSSSFNIVVYRFSSISKVKLSASFGPSTAYSIFSDEALTTLVTKGNNIPSNQTLTVEFTVPANHYLAVSELVANPISLELLTPITDELTNFQTNINTVISAYVEATPLQILVGKKISRSTGLIANDALSRLHVYVCVAGDKFRVKAWMSNTVTYSIFSDAELTTTVERGAQIVSGEAVDVFVTVAKSGFFCVNEYVSNTNVPLLVEKLMFGASVEIERAKMRKPTGFEQYQQLQVTKSTKHFKSNFQFGALTKETGVTLLNLNSLNIATISPIYVEQLTGIAVSNQHAFIASYLDENKAVIGFSGTWESSSGWIPDGTKYVSMVIRRRDLTITNFDNVNLQLSTKPNAELARFDFLRNSDVISKYKNEVLAHGSYPAADLDYIWVVYYCSETIRSESAWNGSIFVRMAKVSPCDMSQPEFIDVLKIGDNVGGFLSGDVSPYDPVIISMPTVVRIIMVADNKNDAVGVRMVVRDYDKATGQMANAIQAVKLRYTHGGTNYNVDMSVGNMKTFVDRILGRTDTNLGFYPIMSKIIMKDGIYYSYLASLAIDDFAFQGCFIKSTDGINWDFVSIPTALNAKRNIWEAGIEIIGDTLYTLIKDSDGYSFLSYNLTSQTWSPVSYLVAQSTYTSQGSRPSLFYWKNKLYAMVNVGPTYNSVFRSRVEISEVDPATLKTIKRRSFIAENGCHYFDTISYRGEPYFFYTEDRKRYDLTSGNAKGNISATHAWFLENQ